MSNNHDRLVTLKPLTAEQARKIAAGLLGAAEVFRMLAAPHKKWEPARLQQADQCEQVARLFEEAANQPELPGTEETALGKL